MKKVNKTMRDDKWKVGARMFWDYGKLNFEFSEGRRIFCLERIIEENSS
jgi:hypothetical protein